LSIILSYVLKVGLHVRLVFHFASIMTLWQSKRNISIVFVLQHNPFRYVSLRCCPAWQIVVQL